MKKYLILFLSVFVVFAMVSCSDDSGVNVIDVPDDNDNDNGEEPTGTVYSIIFNVEGGDTFTFSVDMEDATIEGDDLPEDFEGDVFTFDPDDHRVFIAGSFVDWPEPGSENNLELTRQGAESGVTIEEGSGQFKFFIVPGADPSWDYGEWEGDPNRETDIESGGDYFAEWGDQPDVDEPDVDFVEVLHVAGNFQAASGYGDDWSPADAPQIGYQGTSNVNDGYVYFADEGAEFKLVHGDNWDAGDFGGADGTLTMGGDDIFASDAGYTRIWVNQAEMTYTLTVTEWGIIGDATPEGWDASTEMEFDPETKVWSVTLDLEDGEFKFRANDDWDINYGSDDADGTLQFDGGNIPVDAGNYTIELDLNGTSFEYSIEQN